MRPNRWPYCGNKKQSTEKQIAKLKTEILICENAITSLSREVHYLKTR